MYPVLVVTLASFDSPRARINCCGGPRKAIPRFLQLERLQCRALLLRHDPFILRFTFPVVGHVPILDATVARSAPDRARVLVTHLRAALEAQVRVCAGSEVSRAAREARRSAAAGGSAGGAHRAVDGEALTVGAGCRRRTMSTWWPWTRPRYDRLHRIRGMHRPGPWGRSSR